MPELPEVETVCRDICPHVQGRIINFIELPSNYKRVLGKRSLTQLNKFIANQKVLTVERRAKYIILQLEQGCLAIHLRMTGRLMRKYAKDDLKHISLILHFKDGSELAFKDVRKFGRWDYFADFAELDNKLGVEPLSPKFTAEFLTKMCAEKKRIIKHLLLDQKCIAGLGNIYVDEALSAAEIHPESSSAKIPKDKLSNLCRAVKRILTISIKNNGTTFSSFYYGENQSGDFVNILKVYGRDGEPCKKCKTLIKKIKVQQRGTHYCPKCQKKYL